MKALPAIFLLIVEGLAIRYAYLPWFRPKEYFKLVYGLRERVDASFPFVKDIWTVKLIHDHPRLDLWWARLISLFVVVVDSVVLLGALLQAFEG